MLCRRELASERGAPARAYLQARGIPADRVAHSGVGVRAHAINNVAALGGTSASSRLFEQLAELDITNVTLALDNDPAGRAAATRAIEAATTAARSPHVWIIDHQDASWSLRRRADLQGAGVSASAYQKALHELATWAAQRIPAPG